MSRVTFAAQSSAAAKDKASDKRSGGK